MREVRVRVGKSGRIETDFTGFLDEDCLDEADRLAKALSGLGLSVSLRDRVMKSMAARLEEAGTQVEPDTQTGTGARRDTGS